MYGRQEFGLMKRKVKKGTVWYYWLYDDDDRRIYRSTGCRTKSDALKYVLERRDKNLLGVVDKKGLTFNEFCKDMYVEGKCPIEAHRTSRGKGTSQSTMIGRRTNLTKHILPYFGNTPVSKVTHDKVDRWVLNLVKNGCSQSTANNIMGTLKDILTHAVRNGLLSDNPCEKVERLGNDSQRHESFTLEEVRLIVGREDEWEDPLIRLMCATASVTGIRIGEARALTSDKIGDNYIDVSNNLTIRNELKLPKNGKTRFVPIPEFIRDRLMRFAPVSGGYIFSYNGKTPISVTSIENALKKRCTQVGIKERTFHSFRVFFNTMLTSANVNETVIRSIVGHGSEKMTEHYFHLETADATMIENVQKNILE